MRRLLQFSTCNLRSNNNNSNVDRNDPRNPILKRNHSINIRHSSGILHVDNVRTPSIPCSFPLFRVGILSNTSTAAATSMATPEPYPMTLATTSLNAVIPPPSKCPRRSLMTLPPFLPPQMGPRLLGHYLIYHITDTPYYYAVWVLYHHFYGTITLTQQQSSPSSRRSHVSCSSCYQECCPLGATRHY